MRGLLGLSLGIAASLALVMSASASADVFGPISLVSASPFEQVEYAHDVAISGNARDVVFDGSIGGVTGVWWRENRPGGNLVEVAGGDAELPSISEDGQYVSFTTNEGGRLAEITNGQPDPEHETHEAPNVYVRDMAKEPDQQGAFILASPLQYEYAPGENREVDEERYGSQAAGRTALSADGRKVAFVTTATSDLDGPETPPLQVAVYDWETKTTEPVSVESDPATGRPVIEDGRPKAVPIKVEDGAPYGAVFTSGDGPPIFPAARPTFGLTPQIGASISADGSTVAWLGRDVGKQAQTLADEPLQAAYAEPLWRRIGEGEEAPIRRVTGGSDPANPQCAAHPESELPASPSSSDPCQGPFATEPQEGTWGGTGTGDPIPRLSADGYTVAFLATARLIALGSDFGAAGDERVSDLYVVNMHEGLSRVEALRSLTEVASGNSGHTATNAPILDVAISPDASQVAFTTERTVFPLGSPAYVSTRAGVAGLSELYDADLADNTLTRVTQGYEGGATAQPVREETAGNEDPYQAARGLSDGSLSPSFSENGEAIAFSSTASNLVYGDGNTPPAAGATEAGQDGSDAFVVDRVPFTTESPLQIISAAPPNPLLGPEWALGATALSLADGSVRLYVELPGAGMLRAQATAVVRVRTVVHAARSTRHSSRKAVRARVLTTVLSRTVATAKWAENASAGGLTTLLLRLAPSYSALALQRGGLSSSVELSFTAAGQPVLHQSIAVTFLRTTPVSKTRRSKTAVVHHKSKGGKRR